MDRPRLHYDLHDGGGGAARPSVLFVHGLLSSRAQWIPTLPAFRPHYRAVVVELLGHGRSPSPNDPAAYTPAAYAEQFEAVREALGLERWYVVGQSLGAALTLRYSLDYPDRVIAQVFTNSNSALAPPGREAQVRAFMQQQADELARDGHAALERHRLNPTRARGLPAGVRTAFREDVALHDPRGIALTGLHTIPESSVRARAAQIAVPTLLVVGRRERRFAEARRFAEQTIPGLTVCDADAGHAVNLGAAATFNQAVLAFFRRRPPGGGR